MALLKSKQLKNLSVDELKNKLKELRLELFKERSAVEMRRIGKNTKRIRDLRKNIARILTVLREKGIHA
ncbi:MAG: 50S ribosomal protein L29 [Candidatus Aenigmarchaeota archaeon]|nr:50S ribosomal protein L29 [Candidatus Aenigmarchaeota archaeon]MDW8149755.1 50S ribosomal protein L29 [Candidatus Aenigmarchaeota archaeon]